MTPDVYTQLEIVDATASNLVVSSNPPANVPAFNSYQMAAWFPPGAPSPVAASSKTATYMIQFFRGGGDEDDAADLVVSLGQTGPNLFHLYAGSTPTSAHYLEVIPLAQASSQVVIGVSPAQFFEQSSPSSISWSLINAGQPNVPLSLNPPSPSSPQALVVADLSLLFDAATAASFISAIGTGSLTTEDLQNLYAQVTGYCFPQATTLSYKLTEIEFADLPPVTNGTTTTAVIGQTTATVTSASLEVTVGLDQSVTDTFSLTSDQTWAIGAEVGFDLPIPFIPDATISGSFESASGEAAEIQQAANFGTQATMTMPDPGTYVVTATALIAENYQAPFTGTLEITGVATAPQSAAYPLNGTLLALLLAPGSPRNAGLSIGPITPGPNLVTVPVSGNLTATFGYQLLLSQTTATPPGVTSRVGPLSHPDGDSPGLRRRRDG